MDQLNFGANCHFYITNFEGNKVSDDAATTYDYDRLYIVSKKTESKELNNSIKIGDKVKIINSNDFHNNKKGEVTYKDDEIVTVKLDNGRSFNYNYNQVIKESKELRKYNSRLYGIYDTEKEEYIKTGTLEEMKKEVEVEKEDIEEPKEQETEKESKDININVTIKNEAKKIKEESKAWIRRKLDGLEMTKSEVRDAYKEWLNNNDWTSEEYSFNDYLRDLDETQEWELIESKEIKEESLSEESKYLIINPEDKFYKDGHLFAVIIYSFGWSAVTIYYVYANYEQDALEILVPYLEENAPGLLIDAEDLEDEDLDNFITADGIYYFPANTRIEELDEDEKEKIETEFFKNYKEEE